MTAQTTPKRDINGIVIVDDVPQTLDARFMVNLKVTFDKETGNTEPDESDLIDLYELIQTYKDQCGMEGAARMLRTGQALPGQFADDGKHGFDASSIPNDAQGIANMAIKSRQSAEAFRDKFGIPANADGMTDEQISKLIDDRVNEILGKYIKKEDLNNA